MDCEAIRELLEEYALGALDPAESAQVERHVATCADCRQRAAAWSETVAALPRALAAASPHRPPPSMKERLMAEIAATRLNTPTSLAAVESATNGRAGVPPSAGPRAFAPRRWWPRVAAFATIAALVLLALSLAWGIRLNSALARERQLSADFAQLADQIEGQQEVVLEVLDSPRVSKALLRPPAGSPSSAAPPYGKIYVRPDLPHVVAMINRLPVAPQGQAYHLWLTRDGRTEAAGVLATNDAGFGLVVFDADRNGPVYTAARVTLQPLGSTTEGGTLVLIWEQ